MRVFLPVLLVAAVLGGAATAQERARRSPLKAALGAVGMATDEPPRPDFVARARPAEKDLRYIPIGERRPDRTLKAKTPAEVAAMEAALEAARSRHDAIAKRPPPAGPKR